MRLRTRVKHFGLSEPHFLFHYRASFRNVPRTTEHAVKDFRRVPFFRLPFFGQARKVTEKNAKNGQILFNKSYMYARILPTWKPEDPDLIFGLKSEKNAWFSQRLSDSAGDKEVH